MQYQHGEDRLLERVAQVGFGAFPRLDFLSVYNRLRVRIDNQQSPSACVMETYLASFSMKVESPENDTSMPFTMYGSSMKFFPLPSINDIRL